MVAQIFRPIENVVNDNLIENTGLWAGKQLPFGGYAVDSIETIDGCKSFKGTSISPQFWNSSYIKGSFNFSMKVKSASWSNANVEAIVTMWESIKGSEEHYFHSYTFVPISTSFSNGVWNTVNIPFSIFDSVDTYRFFWYVTINISNGNDTQLYVCQPKLEYGNIATPYCPSTYDNIPWDFDQYNASYQSQKIGDIANVLSYNYKKHRTQVGTFTMTIKKGTLFADQIEPNTFIYYDGDWLIVNDISLDDEIYTITGVDGKGLLAQRITLYDVAQDTGIMGYDVVQGSTEMCLNHYIANNIVKPIDTNRKIPAFTLGENKNRGIANDSYMSRLEPLHELCEKLCKNADIGYDVKVDLLNNKQIFDVIDVTDRSASQRDRNQIIFEKGRNNVLSMEREVGNSNEKNVFYAVKSGGSLEADATVIAVTRGEAQAAGIYRREMQLNVSCDSVADIALYARQQMTPYQKTDSFKISVADVENFDKLFFIGDKVTIRDKTLNVTADVIIEGATKEIENGKKSITLEFGEGKPKIINQLNQKIIQKGV